MNTHDDDIPVYDDFEAVNFILKKLPATAKDKISETDIEYMLDTIYEYFEEKGLIQEDTAEEANIDEDDMFKYLKKCIKRDKMDIDDEEITLILDAEYEYGRSIGVYD